MEQQNGVHFDKELFEALCSVPEESLRVPKEKLDALWRCLCSLPTNVLGYPGRFMYNPISTLRKDDFYLLGINPGGDPEKENVPLRDEIREWLGWEKSASAFDQFGDTPYKETLKTLCFEIGKDLHDICASNLYFLRSPDQDSLMNGKKSALYKLGLGTSGKEFWPTHKAVIDIVEPKCIFVIGTVTFNNVFKLLNSVEKPLKLVKKIPCGKHNCSVAENSDKSLKLIGLPHPSARGLKLSEYPMKQIAEECSPAQGNIWEIPFMCCQ